MHNFKFASAQIWKGNSSNLEHESLDVNDLFKISLIVDDTCQKRYKFNWLLGVVFIISVESGEVVDNEVKSKFCFKCNARGQWDKYSDHYKSWYLSYENIYKINDTSS